MELIVDLHIHSHYSRATSPEMNIASLYRWGKMKGINVIGTGDFTHPKWFSELSEKLEPAENGLFKLKSKYAKEEDKKLSANFKKKLIRFILTVEISNIYSKNGKVRRVHNLIIVPNFEAASEVNFKLTQIGNLHSDGRPILGLDSKELLRISLEADDRNLFIPAHIWTPWFSIFGSKSGFDSIEEAFEELSPHIYAIESGLSSDPFMNWRLTQLTGRTIVSNSDAHSPPKLGREANLLNCELSYDSIIDAIKKGDSRFLGTIEFFPEEGKYHFDGHAKCDVSLTPTESKKLKNICPKCGRPLVIGVMHRVDDLADRPESFKPKNHKSVEYIVPLNEIVAETFSMRTQSKKVKEEYERLLFEFDDEFSFLRKITESDIKASGRIDLSFAIKKMREGDIYIKPGYDGVYGIVKIFKPGERTQNAGQLSFI
ncbi:MAG: DNA helicase UvrD [Candidatus Woesebacteria bacterium]|nr:MAG: DNA helicase UvrD [Candidatus Woesebacteria bacterium]